MNKNGYTLIEMLLTLVVIASMLTLTLHNTYMFDSKHYDFMNAYLSKQVDSLTSRNNLVLEEDDSIYFNENGHVNRGQSINIGRYKIIVHLGNGYLTYEQ